ncbi:iron-sulfur cluster assembly scaffold protein [Cognatishimia sp. WU-CL00825]|uniref:iron-sulfur cluster assembly scaffold protein n=1 Tax=Cognatishimia sp. WU-CL00825 TaxID=3127658 RepID=UPI00310ADEAE
MSGENDLIKLYSGQILALASDMPHAARLEAPDASSKKRAPLCGSTITVDVSVTDGKITDFGQDVKACALGQAAASVVGANIIGRSRAEVETARDDLKAMLKQDGPTPTAPFDGLEVLRPAREYKNRHASILLSLEATLDAFDQAQQAACA